MQFNTEITIDLDEVKSLLKVRNLLVFYWMPLLVSAVQPLFYRSYSTRLMKQRNHLTIINKFDIIYVYLNKDVIY